MQNGTRTRYAGRPLRILAFESHDAGSHRQVRMELAGRGRHDWRWVTRPGRSWKWRMRTGAAELVQEAERSGLLGGEWSPDVIFATSLISMGDLVALLPPDLRSLPSVLYMHENQVAYPVRTEMGAGGERDMHFPVTNLMSMLAADAVLWNSRWNLESFCSGISEVLEHCSDGMLTDSVSRIRARSSIAWPPVAEPETNSEAGEVLHNAPVIVWPHRWEHDKGPDELLDVARESRTGGMQLKWMLLGQCRGEVPGAMELFLDEFADDILHAGFVEDRRTYLSMLARADWVLSTARHEFFGIAAVEAILHGCLPWLPERLSYPEITPACSHGLSPMQPPGNPAAIREACRSHLEPAVAPAAVAMIEQYIEQLALERILPKAGRELSQT